MSRLSLSRLGLKNNPVFGKFQVAALIATALDFFVFYGLTYLFQVDPVKATFIGASCGAVLNFCLSRYWVFLSLYPSSIGSGFKSFLFQAFKYGLVSFGSALLNSFCVFLALKYTLFSPGVARPMASLFVSWFYNFPLHRFVVFR